MASFGMMEILLVLLMGSGNNDVVSLIDAEDYFKDRAITVEAGALGDLASQDPADGKAQIAQLLALRWLGEHGDAVRKKDAIRTQLEAIAGGKKAQDAQGFAKLYALRALAAIDGKKPPVSPVAPKDSLRGDAFRWFPANVQYLAAIDLRVESKASAKDEAFLRTLLKNMPPEFKREAFAFVDVVGNFRVDRLAMGMELKENTGDPSCFYVRITGAWDQKRLLESFKQNQKEATVEEIREPKAEPITLIDYPGSPSHALIGDTELIMARYGRDRDGKHQDLVKQMLEIRAEKKNVLSGSLAELVKKIPDKTNAAAVGTFSDDLRDLMLKSKGLVTAVPSRFLVSLNRDKALTLHAQGFFKDADQAKTFAEDLEGLKSKGLAFLKNPPPNFPLPEGAIDHLRKALEGAKIEAKKETVIGTLEISLELIQAIQSMLEMQVKGISPGK